MALTGAYGLTKRNMEDALHFMGRNIEYLEQLVERLIPLEKVPLVLDNVLSGRSLKYIIGMGKEMHWTLPSILLSVHMGRH